MPIFIISVHRCNLIMIRSKNGNLILLQKLVINPCLHGARPLVGSITQGHLWGKRRESFCYLFTGSLKGLIRHFRRWFRMSLELFFHISNCVKRQDWFLEQRRNCAGDLGHSIIHKVATALCMMAYGVLADFIDDHLAMGGSNSILCVKQFAKVVVEVFEPEYIRAPNAHDTQRLLEMNKARGFPGMLGSTNCLH
jgi:hypothetical protein